MTRIETICYYIEKNEKVIDVGCDQALLSKLLAKKGISSIASDLRENIIKRAEESTPDFLKKHITFRIGDGITLNDDEENYTPVLSGMGAYLILNIIRKSTHTFNKIITISNNDHDVLRCEMLKLGYVVELEEIIKEKNKYYNLIIFKKGKKAYTKEEELIGINHQNIQLLKEKNTYLIMKYKNILKGIKKESSREELENKIKILKNYI